ncbi:alcohol oxidase [Mycena sp. CBHHK59/15]|nr:alcohol oxidase [Mycena sp. CBHHK59/15]
MWPFSTTQYPALSVDQVGIPFDKTNTQAQVKNATYDYIVVGGGTAGCCLASRLSENPAVSVLVLERGGVNDAWFSRIPLISGDVTSKSTPIVRASSAPLSYADGQVVDIVHAETLGGGSSVNAMLVTRGAVGDFNHWAELGHPSWDYASLKPYFIKSEKSLSQHSDGHGHSGPWVNQIFPHLPFEVQRQVKDAALALGLPDVRDFNRSDVPVNVCATMDAAIDSKMCRVSTYHAFLPSEIARKRRSHLKVCTRAVATRVEFDAGVAVGVVFESSNKSIPGTFYARASKEIVICCGALGSPQLLLLSGIGPKEHLQEHGIKAVSDLPGVGAHLQDHVGLPLMYEVPLKHTLHYTENSMLKGLLELVKYLIAGKGIMASTVSPMSLFAHSAHIDEKTATIIDPIPSGGTGTNRPDLEIMTIAHWCSDPPPYKITMGVFSFLMCVVQPKSVGSVRLASGDPHAHPLVDLGFFTDPADFIPLRKGIKLCLRLAEDVRRQGYPMKAFQVPSSEKESDVDQFIRATIRTSYHYASSCRMASRQEGGVVDDELRVYGVRGLRVCDASVFPCITTAHTQAPVVAVAEKCADLMKN